MQPKYLLQASAALSLTIGSACQHTKPITEVDADKPTLELPENGFIQRPNVIFILADDYRYDFFGSTGRVPWLQTPNLDSLAKQSVVFQNSFVTTSLCSPSRASILTGLYPHTHRVVDNQAPDPGNLIYFPQYLQKAGYKTAFLGKWHMGDHSNAPKPGFDYWASFRGQGKYFNNTININGTEQTFDSLYISDLLTDMGMDWFVESAKKGPTFMYLSHKAIHEPFESSLRRRGMYADKPVSYPASFRRYSENRSPDDSVPEWVRYQRKSWHGVDTMYHGAMTFEEGFRRYCETITSLDDAIGRLLFVLDSTGLAKNTVVFFMGDNGFSWGEHGLIDKRHSYEESMRVPLFARMPNAKPDSITYNTLNNDIAPTILALAGRKAPEYMEGQSLLPLLTGEQMPTERPFVFYEYFWEFGHPQTPTQFAIRGEKYKYIRYYGLCDRNEFFDIQNDPFEQHNLIARPMLQDTILAYNKRLWKWLEVKGEAKIPLRADYGKRFADWRHHKQY